jgi:hypothetical protein
MMTTPARGGPPLLIHLHIPKNAGTTLGRLLRLKHSLWPPSRWLHHSEALGFYHMTDRDGVPGWRRRIERIRGLPAEAQRRVRLFEAHAAFGLHDLMPEPCRSRAAYVTLLRDPIDRTISTFSFLRQKGRLEPGATIESFVERGGWHTSTTPRSGISPASAVKPSMRHPAA